MRVPHSIAILGLGPSLNDFVGICKVKGGQLFDEVWGINNTGSFITCDKVFHMDDIRIQESRAKDEPGGAIDNMVKWLRDYNGRVFTSIPDDRYACLEAYPLADVLNKFGIHYFNSTVPYALAYALMIGVKEINIFGCDYTYPGIEKAEKGRACLEYWVGFARGMGVKVGVPETTSLLDTCCDNTTRFYGYDCVELYARKNEEGQTELEFRERDKIPTAKEIEERYDITRHPNPLIDNKEPDK